DRRVRRPRPGRQAAVHGAASPSCALRAARLLQPGGRSDLSPGCARIDPSGMKDQEMTAPRTMFEKIWQRHVVVDRPDGYTLLYADRHLMHDGSSPAYARLKARGMGLRRADRAAATPDHYVKTDSRTKDVPDPDHRRLLNDITTNCNEAGVPLFDLGDARQ